MAEVESNSSDIEILEDENLPEPSTSGEDRSMESQAAEQRKRQKTLENIRRLEGTKKVVFTLVIAKIRF